MTVKVATHQHLFGQEWDHGSSQDSCDQEGTKATVEALHAFFTEAVVQTAPVVSIPGMQQASFALALRFHPSLRCHEWISHESKSSCLCHQRLEVCDTQKLKVAQR